MPTISTIKVFFYLMQVYSNCLIYYKSDVHFPNILSYTHMRIYTCTTRNTFYILILFFFYFSVYKPLLKHYPRREQFTKNFTTTRNIVNDK